MSARAPVGDAPERASLTEAIASELGVNEEPVHVDVERARVFLGADSDDLDLVPIVVDLPAGARSREHLPRCAGAQRGRRAPHQLAGEAAKPARVASSVAILDLHLDWLRGRHGRRELCGQEGDRPHQLMLRDPARARPTVPRCKSTRESVPAAASPGASQVVMGGRKDPAVLSPSSRLWGKLRSRGSMGASAGPVQ